MSAFMVDDSTINNIVSFILAAENTTPRWVLKQHGYTDPKRLGYRMFVLNKQGVESRYGKGQAKEFRPMDYTFTQTKPTNAVQVLKSLHCWRYQCMEGNIPDTRFYKLMTEIIGLVADGIVCSMPEYQQAEWG